MKINKNEYASLCDGKLLKTIGIELTAEDKNDEKIIEKYGEMYYMSEPF